MTPRDSAAAAPAASVASTQARILLVDDSAAVRVQLHEILARTISAHFTLASEGQEALWKAKSERHDLVITDLHMPTMDGLVLIRELRKLPAYEKVPILILTSDPTPERVKAGREAGATGWLIKPPKPDALAMTVRHALFYRN
jgi:two-component system, chemotaxis family, chemotaxis protein CheY